MQDVQLPVDQAKRFPFAAQVSFGAFNNRYCGQSCYIVGRGPTTFDYRELETVSEPVFFINDSVCLETYCRCETFLFVHDAQMLPWLNGAAKSTAVVPLDGKLFQQTPEIELGHTGKIAYYSWREENAEQLLNLSRDEVAEIRQLYTHTGTIHSLLHFVWYCGFSKVTLIGCDCINQQDLPAGFCDAGGYDARLKNVTGRSSANYAAIGRAQSLLIQLFGLEAIYLGTPGRP